MPSQSKMFNPEKEQEDIKFLVGLLGCKKSEITDNKGNCLLDYNTLILNEGNITIYRYNIYAKCCNQEGIVAGRGSDDTTYMLFSILQRICPRSYSVYIIKDVDGNELERFTIQGIPKFSSKKNGDEDSGTACGDVLLQNIYKATDVIVTTKANGKFMLFSMKKINGVLYGIVGSKNVHRMFQMSQFQEFIDSSEGLIQSIASEVKSLLDNISTEQREAIIDKLTSGFSFIGEFIDGKHIEVSDGNSRIEFFGITENIGTIPEDYSLTENPITSFNEIESYGLPTVSYTLYTISEFNQLNEQELRSGMTEGKVYYYLEHEKVVGIEKFKTVWYTIWRMVREAIKNMKSVETLHSSAKSVCSQRLLKRSQDFLNLPDTVRFGWEKVIFRFIDWFISKGYTGPIVGIDDTSRGMGTILGQWLDECPNETSEPLETDLDGSRGVIGILTELKKKVLIIFQGVPGIGKTTIAKKLFELFGIPYYEKDIDKDCFNKMEKVMEFGETETIIYSSNNSGGMNERDVEKLVRIANTNGFKVLSVHPKEFDSDTFMKILKEFCLKRMIRREGHVTITQGNMTDEQYRKHCLKILDGFISRYSKISNQDGIISKGLNYLNGEVQEDLDTLVRKIKEMIDEVRETEMKVDIVPQFEYLKLDIPKDKKKKLKQMIPEMIQIEEGHKVFLHHVTTSTTNDKDPKWKEKKAMKFERTQIRIVPHSYYYKVIDGKTHIVILVDLFDNTGKESMNHLVFSGVPHITTVLPEGMAPKESVQLVKNAEEGDIKPITLPKGFSITSTMS